MSDDEHNVSGACCYCFTGFGGYHEPGCPRYEKPAQVAQPVEPRAENPWGDGSNPSLGTTQAARLSGGGGVQN